MALNSKSVLTYGITVTTLNNAIDFKNTSGGGQLTAILTAGAYSPTSLAVEIGYQLQSIDPVNIYTVTVARNIFGGTQNRITISTNGTFLSLLFSSGSNASTSAAGIMGYNPVDYTGSTSYSGSQSMGTALVPEYIGYNYLDDSNMAKLYGAVNISSSGLKEAVTYSIQKFIEVEFKYISKANLPFWQDFFFWAIQQQAFDFTPQISDPDTVYNVTLEKTDYQDQGMGFRMPEMLPDFPNVYMTGPLVFRIIENTSQFII